MSKAPQYLIKKFGELTAVVLPINDYERLLKDLADLAAVAERRDDAVISHEEFLADLSVCEVETKQREKRLLALESTAGCMEGEGGDDFERAVSEHSALLDPGFLLSD